MLLLCPVLPYRGLRGADSWGDGSYGAPRSRKGKPYKHKGLDIVTEPLDLIIAPFSGRLNRRGIAYAGSDLGSIHLAGVGLAAGYKVKILYARAFPHFRPGYVFRAGEPMAVAQDVSGYHAGRQPNRRGRMKNHIHLELWKVHGDSNEVVDPTPLMEE